MARAIGLHTVISEVAKLECFQWIVWKYALQSIQLPKVGMLYGHDRSLWDRPCGRAMRTVRELDCESCWFSSVAADLREFDDIFRNKVGELASKAG